MNQLAVQMLAATGLMAVMSLIHAMGVIAISRMLGLEDRSLRAHRVNFGALMLLVSMALCLFAVHLIEIGLFALFYHGVGAVDGIEPAIYYSTSAYTTLGTVDGTVTHDWRLVGAIEGLIGFLMIGWSTGVFIADMNKLLREEA